MIMDLMRTDGTPCVRPIFNVYILLFDPYFIIRNRSLRLNKKKAIYCLYILFIYIDQIGDMSPHIKRNIDAVYINILMK